MFSFQSLDLKEGKDSINISSIPYVIRHHSAREYFELYYMYSLLLVIVPMLILCSCAEQEAGSTPQSDKAILSEGEGSNSTSLPKAEATAPPDERVGSAPSDKPYRQPFPPLLMGNISGGRNDSADSGTLNRESLPLVNVANDAPTPKRLPPLTYHRGVNHAHVHRRGNGYGSEASAREHDWLRSIGGNAIAITPFGFQQGAKSAELVGFGPDDIPGTRDRSMKLEDMAAEVDSAHKRGLRVMLKPHIWSNDFWNGSEWHGSVDQKSAADHKTWWASYRKMILYYAEFAESAGIDSYCLGTELLQMTTKYPNEWRTLIADVRNVYKGQLTYAAHWDREWREITFWDALDYIGIGAYFPLKVSDSASINTLVEEWQPYRKKIDSIAQKFNRPVLFLEIGYRAVAGTWREPWLYTGGAESPDAQGKAFEALLQAFQNDKWFKGMYVWKTFTDPNAARREGEQTDFQFKGLSGEVVLKKWWRGGT
ncbi:MAG: glycoside hydrolase TIM-barrel-like domain-containing protein [Candidatus Kapaibacterium sp.]